MLLHHILGKEKEEEKEDLKIEIEKEVPIHLLERIKESSFLKSSVLDVISVVTILVVSPGDKRIRSMHLLQTVRRIHL